MDAEGAAMYRSAEALRDAMIELGMACDGGKDSLSMAASAGGDVVKAPGNVVISAYAPCPDITKTVTPDFKQAGSAVLLVPLSDAVRRRLGWAQHERGVSAVFSHMLGCEALAQRVRCCCIYRRHLQCEAHL